MSFSTHWKNNSTVFHSLEKKFPHDGKRPFPILMGILNATPDSFSDGGAHASPAAAVRQALRLREAGVQILDVGAESTRPGYTPVEEQEECRRLLPVLDALAAALPLPLSVDTQKPGVARAALEHGAAWLNDIGGLSAPGMLAFARQGRFPIVLMHGVGHKLDPADPQPSASIAEWADRLLPRLKLNPSRLILDPGIGFGTTREQDAGILANLKPLVDVGLPLLIGLSRKRVVRFLHPQEEIDQATARLAWQAGQNGAAILRLHNPAAYAAFAASRKRPS
ncbi:MAG: dihydropteroate synthase [Verrucomicrobiota bacterium]|nr:dihydropteroate synthase [Verrucomicrobiota bacterium]